jgi:two-component system NtrC family sensor kinase
VGRFADRRAPRCRFAGPVLDALIPIAKADLVRLVEELTANGMEAAGPNGFVDVRAERAGECVEIRIVDSGPGFTSAERAHAFAPFFAGRSAGRGLGMGLPVCRRIAERVGGRIEIGRGRPTCVTVQLPLAHSFKLQKAA